MTPTSIFMLALAIAIVLFVFEEHIKLFFIFLLSIPDITHLWVIYKIRDHYLKTVREKGIFCVEMAKATRLDLEAETKKEKIQLKILNLLEDNQMIKIRKQAKEIRYTPQDQEEGSETVFVFRAIKPKEKARYRDQVLDIGTDDEGNTRMKGLRSNQINYESTLKRLVGWENLANADGDQIPFDEEDKQEVYDALPEEIREELEAKFGALGGDVV